MSDSKIVHEVSGYKEFMDLLRKDEGNKVVLYTGSWYGANQDLRSNFDEARDEIDRDIPFYVVDTEEADNVEIFVENNITVVPTIAVYGKGDYLFGITTGYKKTNEIVDFINTKIE